MGFRYHLVAVGAIVVAVVAGLFLSAAALDGPASTPVRSDVDAAGQPNGELAAEIDRLGERRAEGQRLAQELAPMVLGGRLADKSVVVLVTASAAADVAGVETMLTVAGATVTGRVELTDRFSDPQRRDDLLGLAVASRPPGVTGDRPTTTDGVLATAALFGAVLLRQSSPVPPADVRGVLSAYIGQGFLTGPSGVSGPADAAIVLSGDSADGAALGGLAEGLSAGAGVVVAGSTASADTAVARVRREAATKVSTVDNIGTPEGKLAAAWAVADRISGRVGHYGTGPGATGALPMPVPAPTAPPAPPPAEPPPGP